MAGRRRRTTLGGTVVLDADGVSKAAAVDRLVHAMLVSARHHDARVVVSAVTLAEVLRGTSRDAAAYRVLTRVAELPVTTEIGRAAGALLGSTGLSGATVDAVVAATALRQPGPVLLVTSDPISRWQRSDRRADHPTGRGQARLRDALPPPIKSQLASLPQLASCPLWTTSHIWQVCP